VDSGAGAEEEGAGVEDTDSVVEWAEAIDDEREENVSEAEEAEEELRGLVTDLRRHEAFLTYRPRLRLPSTSFHLYIFPIALQS